MLDAETGAGIPYGADHYATQMVEVQVDDETGQFEVLRVVAGHDVGRVVNPMALEGQIDGGVVMGLGFGALENLVVEDGVVKNTGFGSYLLPTSLDAAPVEAILVEEPEPTGPFGAKGAGEPPSCPTAAALVSAIRDAVGVDITSLPVTAEKVYLALKELSGQ